MLPPPSPDGASAVLSGDFDWRRVCAVLSGDFGVQIGGECALFLAVTLIGGECALFLAVILTLRLAESVRCFAFFFAR